MKGTQLLVEELEKKKRTGMWDKPISKLNAAGLISSSEPCSFIERRHFWHFIVESGGLKDEQFWSKLYFPDFFNSYRVMYMWAH